MNNLRQVFGGQQEKELPRLIRGQVCRCVGNYDPGRDVLVCVSVRAALPTQLRNAQEAVKASNAVMGALVKTHREVWEYLTARHDSSFQKWVMKSDNDVLYSLTRGFNAVVKFCIEIVLLLKRKCYNCSRVAVPSVCSSKDVSLLICKVRTLISCLILSSPLLKEKPSLISSYFPLITNKFHRTANIFFRG